MTNFYITVEHPLSAIDCSIRLIASMTVLLGCIIMRILRAYYSFQRRTMKQGRIPEIFLPILCVMLSGTYYTVFTPCITSNSLLIRTFYNYTRDGRC